MRVPTAGYVQQIVLVGKAVMREHEQTSLPRMDKSYTTSGRASAGAS